MKQNYIKPLMTEVTIQQSQNLLLTSEVKVGTNDYQEGDVVLGRQHNNSIWDKGCRWWSRGIMSYRASFPMAIIP